LHPVQGLRQADFGRTLHGYELTSFPSTRDAKECLVTRVVEQAKRDNHPLPCIFSSNS